MANTLRLRSDSFKLIASAFGYDFESDQLGPLTVVNHNQSIELGVGWHLIGVPLNLYDPFSENLFPAGNPNNWTIFTSEGDFNDINVHFSQGYYLALQSPQELFASGVPVTSANLRNAG